MLHSVPIGVIIHFRSEYNSNICNNNNNETRILPYVFVVEKLKYNITYLDNNMFMFNIWNKIETLHVERTILFALLRLQFSDCSDIAVKLPEYTIKQ